MGKLHWCAAIHSYDNIVMVLFRTGSSDCVHIGVAWVHGRRRTRMRKLVGWGEVSMNREMEQGLQEKSALRCVEGKG